MKNLIIIFLLCFYFHSNSQNWTLVWEDDFGGNVLDNTKWAHELGTGTQYGLFRWGNGELQYYQSQNTTLNNGIATITVKEEPAGLVDNWGNTSYYSSSKITTKGIFDFRYGKVESRIKTIDGEGFWPAFWMLPTGGSWPCDGEIDIMEQWGNNYLTNNTTGAAHLGDCPHSQSTHFYQSFSNYISSGSFADDFHIYSIIWKTDTISWYVDDIELFSVTPESYTSIPSQSFWPFNSNQWYLMINLGITSSGPNSNTVFPNQIEVDYVRVYQSNVTSVSESISDISNIIYPNPTDGKITINEKDISSMTLLDIYGSRVLEVKTPLDNQQIDINHLSDGMYLLQYIKDDITFVNKIKLIK